MKNCCVDTFKTIKTINTKGMKIKSQYCFGAFVPVVVFNWTLSRPNDFEKKAKEKDQKNGGGGEYTDQMRIGQIQKQWKNKKINKQCGDICQSAI